MRAWLNSIKLKSKQVLQLYKNELSNMVYQLDDDIKTLKHNIKTKKEKKKRDKEKNAQLKERKKQQEMKKQQEKKAVVQAAPKQNEVEMKQIEEKTIVNLLVILQEYDKEIQNNQENLEFLQEQIEFVRNNIDLYFRKDPTQLVMIERDDFTNFHVFEEIPNIDQQAQELLTINVFKNLTNDVKVLKRVLYYLIYQFHEKILYSLNQFAHSPNSQISDEYQDFDYNQYMKETKYANIQQDDIDEQQDTSSALLHKQPSPAKSLDEEWEIDESMFVI